MSSLPRSRWHSSVIEKRFFPELGGKVFTDLFPFPSYRLFVFAFYFRINYCYSFIFQKALPKGLLRRMNMKRVFGSRQQQLMPQCLAYRIIFLSVFVAVCLKQLYMLEQKFNVGESSTVKKIMALSLLVTTITRQCKHVPYDMEIQ